MKKVSSLILACALIMVMLPTFASATTTTASANLVFTIANATSDNGQDQYLVTMSAKNAYFNGVQVTLGFDTTKVQLARKDTNAPSTTASQVAALSAQATAQKWDSSTGEGWFVLTSQAYSNSSTTGKGKIDYTFNVSAEAVSVDNQYSPDATGNYTLDATGMPIVTWRFQKLANYDANTFFIYTSSTAGYTATNPTGVIIAGANITTVRGATYADLTGIQPQTIKLATVARPALGADKTLTWTGVANASSYTISLKKDGTAGTPITGVSNTATTYDLSSLISASGSYTATVQAIGDGTTYTSGDASNDSNAFVIPAAPTKLGTVATPTLAKSGDTYTLTWTSVANASSYTVVLKKDGTALGSPITGITTSPSDVTAAIVAGGTGSYTATVQAIGNGTTYSDGDASSISNAVSYTTPAIKLGTVGNVALSTSKSLTWDSVDHASSYTVVLKKDGTAIGTPITSATSPYDLTSKIVAGGDGTYTATVQAIGDGTVYSNGDASESNSLVYTAPVIPTVSVGNVQVASINQSIDVPVKISALGVGSYNGSEIEITFNKDDLTFASVSNGDLKDGLSWNATAPAQANTDGKIRVTLASTTSFSASDITNTNKTLFKLTFTAKVVKTGGATSTITPTSAVFLIPSTDPYTVSAFENGTVSYTAAPVVTNLYTYTGETTTDDDYTIYAVTVPAGYVLTTSVANTDIYCYYQAGMYVVASKSTSLQASDFTLAVGTPTVSIKFGDVNNDGLVDITDATIIAQDRANFVVTTNTRKIIAANVNADSNITTADAVDVVGKILTLIANFKITTLLAQ